MVLGKNYKFKCLLAPTKEMNEVSHIGERPVRTKRTRGQTPCQKVVARPQWHLIAAPVWAYLLIYFLKESRNMDV